MPYTTRRERALRRATAPMLLAGCCVLLSVAVAMVVRVMVPPTPGSWASSSAAEEKRGVPGAALQRTYGLTVPSAARDASYLAIPGDGSADSSQDLYLRFRTTPKGLREFVRSMGAGTGELAAGTAALDQDDIDSVGLPWKIRTEGHLAGLYADLPEPGDTVGTALLTVDETDTSAPLVYAHVTV